MSEVAYAQLPAEQVPASAEVRTVVSLTQKGAGGWAQTVPAHGSSMHSPSAQPLVQATSRAA